MTQAVHFPKASSSACWLSSRRFSQSSTTYTAWGTAWARMGYSRSSTAMVSNPTPLRKAAWAAITQAPAMPQLPHTSSSLPMSPLLAWASGWGSHCRGKRLSVSKTRVSAPSTKAAGTPTWRTTVSPQNSLAG